MVARNSIHVDGVLGTASPERWSIGLHYVLSDEQAILGTVDLQQWVTDAAGFWASSASTNMVAEWSSAVSVTGMRAYGYGPSGPAQVTANVAVTKAGTGTVTCPPQVARCVSLLGPEIGRTKRGRFYMPTLAAQVSSSTLKSAPRTGFAAACADMIEYFRDAAPGGLVLVPVVYSPTANTLTQVSRVRVGDVLDTQRRRRDALVESYEQISIAP